MPIIQLCLAKLVMHIKENINDGYAHIGSGLEAFTKILDVTVDNPSVLLKLNSRELNELVRDVPIIPFWVQDKSSWTLRDHLKRIKYFVESPTNDPICLDFLWRLDGNGSLNIVDGCHRLLAAIILKKETININYIGKYDIMQNLKFLWRP